MSKFRSILEDIIIPRNSVLKIIYEKRKDEILEIPEGSDTGDYHIFGIVEEIGKKYSEDPDIDLQDYLASLKQAIMRRFRIQASQMKQWLEELKEQENEKDENEEELSDLSQNEEISISLEHSDIDKLEFTEEESEEIEEQDNVESETSDSLDDEESFNIYRKRDVDLNSLEDESEESDESITFSEESSTDNQEIDDLNKEELKDSRLDSTEELSAEEELEELEPQSIPSEAETPIAQPTSTKNKSKERKKIVLSKSNDSSGGFFDDVTVEKKDEKLDKENEEYEDQSYSLYSDEEIAYDRSLSQSDGTATNEKSNRSFKGLVQKARKEYDGEYGGYYSEEDEIRGSLSLEDLLMLNEEQVSKEELGVPKIIEYMIQMTKKIDILSRRLTTVESQMPHTGMLEVGSMFKAYPDRIELYKNNKHYLTLRNTFHNFGHRTDVISMRNHVEYEGDNWVVGISPNVQTSPNIPKYTYSFDPVKFEKILQRLISKK